MPSRARGRRSRSPRVRTSGRPSSSDCSNPGDSGSSSSIRPARPPTRRRSSGSSRPQTRRSQPPTGKRCATTPASWSATPPCRRRSTSGRSTRAPTSSSTRGSKYLTGKPRRAPRRGGHACPERRRTLRFVRSQTGGVAATAFGRRAPRGLDSLPDRMRRITETSTELARRLDEHPAVELVRYPGYSGTHLLRRLRSAPRRDEHPRDHELDEPRRRRLDDGEPLPLGGRPHPRGLLRLSVGLEEVDVLWADLEQRTLVKHATEYLTFETPNRRDYLNITDRSRRSSASRGSSTGSSS